MTSFSGSHEDLWQYLSGPSSSSRPPELIKEELLKYDKYLSNGLAVYKRTTSNNSEALSKIKTDKKRKFIAKLAAHLGGLDVDLCLELFNSFLSQFKGTIDDMRVGLDDERYTQTLLHEFCEFYHNERLYLLRCIKHILSYWQVDEHAHKNVYSAFVQRQTGLITSLLVQYDLVVQDTPPDVSTYMAHMSKPLDQIWMINNLKEQCELLEIMMLYYKDFDKSPQDVISLIDRFKKQGFGRHQINKHLLEPSMASLVSRIGRLQMLIVLECMDLEQLNLCVESDSVSSHFLIGDSFKAVNDIIISLGDVIDHTPIMLAWTVFRHVTHAEAGATKRLGNSALQMDVFLYMFRLITEEPLDGKTFVASLSRYVLYSLMVVLLNVFVESSLGDSQPVFQFTCELLKHPFISEDVWAKGLNDGVGTLVKSCYSRLDQSMDTCLQMCAALATDSAESGSRVRALLDEPVCEGCSGWRMISTELEHCIQALEYSSGFVKSIIPVRIQLVMDLVAALVHPSFERTNDVIAQLDHMIQPVFPLIQRLSLLPKPPIDVIRSCLRVVVALAQHKPNQVWAGFRQTNFLPFLTENFTNVGDACSGNGVSDGLCGQLLAASEITHGLYPVTTSLLDLLLSLIQRRVSQPEASASLTTVATIPCLLYVVREIFPAFRKWRYQKIKERAFMGQKCLEIFHHALSGKWDEAEFTLSGKWDEAEFTLSGKWDEAEFTKVTSRSIVYYSLLYTESGRTLLDIIGTGASTVDLAMKQQGSVEEGVGMDLTRQIRLAFSVLNQLMVLRPSSCAPSPVENALFAQSLNAHQRHLVVTVAQYIYVRHDSRLPTMAALLLKRLAMLSPMSLMACMGNEASVIRNVFVSRLQSHTEDIRLRVVILELLTICVDTQPGFIEHFLNIKLKDGGKTGPGPGTAARRVSTTSDKRLVLGDVSCLKSVLSLLKENREGTAHCPPELLCSVTEFLHALWFGRRETAMELLRQTPNFWQDLFAMFMTDLPPLTKDQDLTFSTDLKTLSFIIRILSLELHSVYGEVDPNLSVVLTAVKKEERLTKWSKYISSVIRLYRPGVNDDGEGDNEVITGETFSIDSSPDWTGHSCIDLLCAWRQLLIVIAAQEEGFLKLESAARASLLSDILSALRAELSINLNRSRLRIVSVLADLHFILLKHWKSDVSVCGMMNKLTMIFENSITDTDRSLPSLHSGLLGSLIILLHFKNSQYRPEDRERLLKLVCQFLRKTSHQLVPQKHSTSDSIVTAIKPQIMAVCLLEELIRGLENADAWMHVVQEYAVIPLLIASLAQWIEARQCMEYVEALVMFFQTLAKTAQSAEALSMNGFSKNLCLIICHLYGDNADLVHPRIVTSQSGETTWLVIYRQLISLQSTMISNLRFGHLQDAMDFIGVHHQRMEGCLNCVRWSLSPCRLLEARAVCHLIYSLCLYRRQWRLQAPQIMASLLMTMNNLVQTCVSLLIRPQFLLHLISRHTSEGVGGRKHELLNPSPGHVTALRLTSQSSGSLAGDDSEQPTHQLLTVQHHLVMIVAEAMCAYRKLSPDLCEILLDSSIDVSEYEPLLVLAFSTPSVDQESIISYGSLISLITWCTSMLSKIEPRGLSPAKSPTPADLGPLTKGLLLFVLENTLVVIMSQAAKLLRDASSSRDKQYLKRELGAELNTFLQSFQRSFRKCLPASPGQSTLAPTTSLVPSPQLARTVSQVINDHLAYKIVNSFVEQVLK